MNAPRVGTTYKPHGSSQSHSETSSRRIEWKRFLEMPETQELVVRALRQGLGLEPSIQPLEAF